MDGQNWNNEQSNTSASQNNAYYYQEQAPMQANAQEEKASEGLAIASLICGILSLVCCCCNLLGLALGIAAIVCAVLAQRRGSSGMAIAGLVCGIIGCLFSMAVLVMVIVLSLNGGVSGYGIQNFYRHMW